jgi:uncharacterized protein
MKAGERGELLTRVSDYLSSRHVMSIVTAGAAGNAPHAANVFYVMDDHMRLIFLSRRSSQHGRDIGKEARVAVTVSEQYEDWREIQGVQLWGRARLLTGTAKAGALAGYLARFPFARDILSDPGFAARVKDTGVYRVEADKVAFTDNTSTVFGRETIELARD